MNPRFASIAAVLAAACLFACNKEKTPAVAPAAPANPQAAPAMPGDLPPDAVVAISNGEKITEAQLDEQTKGELQKLDDEYQKRRFDLKRQQLEEMILTKLIKAEAAKRGLTDEQYMKAEVNDKLAQPSDAEIKAFWDANSARLPPGASLDQFKDRVVEALTKDARAKRASLLFDGLKKAAGVQIKLSEPRKPVDAKGPSRGPTDAKVTIVEFSDFQCPYCGKAHDTVEEVMKTYAGKVRLVFRNFPLDFHPYAEKAAEAAMCADEQGKFWEYYDVLFTNQQKLEVSQLKEHAQSVGLDAAKFTECLDSGRAAAGVRVDQQAGSHVGVTGTPAFFINGVMLSGAQPIDEFKRVIDQELAN